MYDYVVFAEETAAVGLENIGEELAGQLETAVNGIDFTVLYKPFIMLLPIGLTVSCTFAGIQKGIGLIMGIIRN